MVNQLVRFMKEEEGATAIEYGLLAALIAAVIVGTVGTLGGTVNTAFSNVHGIQQRQHRNQLIL
jgi:pilus assembly protein Flp/PilA